MHVATSFKAHPVINQYAQARAVASAKAEFACPESGQFPAFVPRPRTDLSSPAWPWMKGKMNEHAHRPDLSVTMRFDPEEGIADLEQHLDELKRQADVAGFRFDHHAARNELQAATFGRRRAALARMLLSPTGAIAIEVKPG